MANPFYNPQQSMPTNFGNLGDLKSVYQTFAKAKNPMQLFMNMASKNPNMQHIITMIQSGGNPQMVFNQLCQQRGINPHEFIKNITG